jgi:hypothetical protein
MAGSSRWRCCTAHRFKWNYDDVASHATQQVNFGVGDGVRFCTLIGWHWQDKRSTVRPIIDGAVDGTTSHVQAMRCGNRRRSVYLPLRVTQSPGPCPACRQLDIYLTTPSRLQSRPPTPPKQSIPLSVIPRDYNNQNESSSKRRCVRWTITSCSGTHVRRRGRLRRMLVHSKQNQTP